MIRRQGYSSGYVLPGGAVCSQIVFYNNKTGEAVVKINNGTLTNHTHALDEVNGIIALDIPEPTRARKANLKRLDPFFVVLPQDALDRRLKAEPKAALYIPTTIAEVTIGQEQIAHESKAAVSYARPVIIKLDMIRLEFVEELPDGGWETREVRISAVREKVRTRTELTSWGQEVAAMYQKLKALKIDIDRYDLERLMEQYTLTVKEP